MNRLDVTARERTSTQAGAMDLNSGRLAMGELLKVSAFMAGAWLVVMLGLLLVAIVQGGSAYEWRAVTLLRYFVGGLGAGLAALAGWLGATAAHGFSVEWAAYRRRRDAWHRAELRAYAQAGGSVVERQLTVKALTTQEPAHLLLVALALAEKIRAEQVTEPSLSALQGDVWLGRIKVGELSKPAAEEFLKALGQMGVIRGRVKGKAGQLATVAPGELIEMVSSRAGRVKSLPEIIEREPAQEEGER